MQREEEGALRRASLCQREDELTGMPEAGCVVTQPGGRVHRNYVYVSSLFVFVSLHVDLVSVIHTEDGNFQSSAFIYRSNAVLTTLIASKLT